MDEDIPLTERGYLVNAAYTRTYLTYQSSPWEPALGHIAAIFYLYGAEFNGIYGGYEGTIKADKENVQDYKRIPSLFFRYQNPPLVWHTQEISIIAKGLRESKHNTWYPMNWTTKEGARIQARSEQLLKKRPWTAEARKWKKRHDSFCRLVDKWQKDFLHAYNQKSDFKLKIYDRLKEAELTILDEKMPELKTAKEIKKRQMEHRNLLEAFAKYLSSGFLNRNRLFPRCKFE